MGGEGGSAATLAAQREVPKAESGPGGRSAVAWRPPRGGLEEAAWLELGRKLGANARANQWWIGDWLQYGNHRWGEKYSRAAKVTGLDAKTLRNIASVASRIDVSRRRDKLTFSVHAEVAALDHDDQIHWLDVAEANRMTVLDLRTEIAASHRKDAKAQGSGRGTRDREEREVVCPECEHSFAIYL